MKKLIIGAVAALTAVGLTSSATSAQDGAYDFPVGSSVTASTECATDGNPTFDWNIGFNGTLKGQATYRLRFVATDGSTFAEWISPIAPSGSNQTFPIDGASYVSDGWVEVPEGQLDPGDAIAALRVQAQVIDAGDGNATYTSPIAPINVTGECVAALPPPTTTTPPPPTTLPPGQLPPPGIEQPPPPAPEEQVLPPTGLSGFDMTMRGAALFLIAGLGFVIVARRRRFATATAST